MKQHLLLLGGFWGFAVSFAAGYVAGNGIETMLFNASLGLLIGAMLFKWIGDLLFDAYVVQKRRSAAALATAQAVQGGKK